MDAIYFFAAAGLIAIATIAAILLAPSYIAAKVRLTLAKEASTLQQTLYELRAERARAAGTIATAVRRGAMVAAPAVAPAIAAAVAQDALKGAEVEVPDWLVTVAKGAGIDVGRILSGDMAEIAKVKALLQGVTVATSGENGAPQSWGAYPNSKPDYI